MTTTIAIASVPTDHSSRYLQQLCKHWSHRLETEFDASRGVVRFPNGAVGTMTSADHALEVRIEAPDAETRDAMKPVIEQHLDRFAFREAPLSFHWRETA